MKVQFQESFFENYGARTTLNAQASDATLAFALNFNTAGEQLTKRETLKFNKTYIPIKLTNELKINDDIIRQTVNELNFAKCKILNIAGNGIYTLQNFFTQQQMDDYVYLFLKSIIEHKNLKYKIELIHSGGQTGVDEAGLKASLRLKIPCLCICPKGYKFRTIEGKDVLNEKEFKKRFEAYETNK